VSATSSAQSHGGARTVDCRPQPLRPVPPDPNAAAVDRFLASSVGARLLSRQSGRSCTEHLGRPSLQDGVLAIAECRGALMGE
jgi:hypothetical protein